VSGWFGIGAKAAAWPHRLEQLEKKLSGFVEAQTKANAEFIQLIHELRVDLTKPEGSIREVVTEAKNAAAGQTAAMTHQVHSDVASIRERLARMETRLEVGRRLASNGPDQPKLQAPP
jgi:ubiquinone biosynthesis protein UbiJ